MIRFVQIQLATLAHRNAARRLRRYNHSSNKAWNVGVAIAYEQAECAAANRLALLINPHAITRAW